MKRYDVYLINLDPTIGSEIKKTRPCVIVSPNDLNRYLNTLIVAPLTSTIRSYPTRINIRFKGKNGEIVLDQLRTVDKKRLIKKLGIVNEDIQKTLSEKLIEMFS